MVARINISIPDPIKARMDAAGESVNWSKIAAEAFEMKLNRADSDLLRRIGLEDLQHAARDAMDGAGVLDALVRIIEQVDGVDPGLIDAIRDDLRPVVDRLFKEEKHPITTQVPFRPTGKDVADAIQAAISAYHELTKTATNRLIFELIALRLQVVLDRVRSRPTRDPDAPQDPCS